MKASYLTTSVALLLVTAMPARAQHVTSATPGMTNAISLAGCVVNSFDPGPITLPGGIVFSSNNNVAVPCYALGYGLADNGFWDGALGLFSGLNASTGWMRFTFANAVSQVGAFVNYVSLGGSPYQGTPFIEALDASNNVIDAFAVDDFVTPGGVNAGAFRGIVHNANDIYAVQFSNAFITARDIQYGTAVTATPEPASLILVGTGITGLAGFVRRRRKS
jgi:hypothetical protein